MLRRRCAARLGLGLLRPGRAGRLRVRARGGSRRASALEAAEELLLPDASLLRLLRVLRLLLRELRLGGRPRGSPRGVLARLRLEPDEGRGEGVRVHALLAAVAPVLRAEDEVAEVLHLDGPPLERRADGAEVREPCPVLGEPRSAPIEGALQLDVVVDGHDYSCTEHDVIEPVSAYTELHTYPASSEASNHQ